MPTGRATIQARASHPSLSPYVIGFAERAGLNLGSALIELPFGIPVVHIALGSGHGPNVAFGGGSAIPQTAAAIQSRPMFVIALGFAGAALLLREAMPAPLGKFVEIEGRFWTSLHVQLSEAPTFDLRVDIAERLLKGRAESASARLSQFSKAADAVIQDRWAGSVSELAREFGVEERTLRNRFRRELGWTPKRLLRVARFNRVLRALHPQSWAGPPSWDVRLEFADDAHLHHEFSIHAGFSPSAFVSAKRSSGDAMLHNVSLVSLGRTIRNAE
jgi:AraC-like DNA-binding protein